MLRLHPSPLLRAVTLLSCLVLLLGTICFAGSAGWSLGMFVFTVLVWLVGLESGLLPWAIAWFASRAARNVAPGTPIRSRL